MKVAAYSGVLLVLLIAGAWLFFSGALGTSTSGGGASSELLPRRATPIQPVESSGGVVGAIPPRQVIRSTRPRAGDKFDVPKPDFKVSGLVASSQGESVEGFAVGLIWNRHANNPEMNLPKEQRLVETSTREDGAFTLHLIRYRWNMGQAYRMRVLDKSGRVRFDGDYVLVHEGLVLLEETVTLRGTVVADWLGASRVRAYRASHVGSAPPRFVGSESVGVDGRFSIRIEAPQASQVMLLVASTQRTSYQREFDLRDLIHGDGVRFVLRGVPLQVSVFDEEEDPITGCKVAVASYEAARNRTSSSASTDESGLASLVHNPEMSQEVTAHADGYAFHATTLEKGYSDRQFRVRLRRLQPADRVYGFVYDGEGKPVANAVVSATYTTKIESLEKVVTTRSAKDGAYEFLVGANTPIRLMAYDRALGPSATETVEWGGVRQDFWIMQAGDVEIGTFAPKYLEARSGSMSYVMTHLGLKLSFTGESHAPIRRFDVPAGQYNCAILSADKRLYGEYLVSVKGGGHERATVRLEEVSRIRGRVSSGAMAGYRVRVKHKWWPAAVRESWGISAVHSDGTFELFCGMARSADIEILDKRGQTIAESRVVAGQPNVVVVSKD